MILFLLSVSLFLNNSTTGVAFVSNSPDTSFRAGYMFLSVFQTRGKLSSIAFFGKAGIEYLKFKGDTFLWDVYQLYCSLHLKRGQIKLGKIVNVPGFLSLFNPLERKKNWDFGTISERDGDGGVLVRYPFSDLSAKIFLFEDQGRTSAEGELRLNLSWGEVGIYSRMDQDVAWGVFSKYTGPLTLSLSLFGKEKPISYHLSLEKLLHSLLLRVHYFKSREPIVFPLPFSPYPTGEILSLEITRPFSLFEIPYLLMVYDPEKNNLLSVIYLRILVGERLSVESALSLNSSPPRFFLFFLGLNQNFALHLR